MGQTTEDLRAQITDQRDALGRDLEAIGDRVSPARMAERRKAAVRHKWESTKSRVMGTTNDAASSASDMASGVGDTIKALPNSAVSAAEGNPLAVGLVAFGAGLVIATLLPESRSERQLATKVQPVAEDAARELGTAAQEAVGQLKPKAQEAVAQVKESAQDSVSQVKEQAGDAATQVKEAAQQQPGAATAPRT